MKNTKSFPALKLPMSKKTQAWKEACVDYVVGAGDSGVGSNGRTRSDEMLTYYDLYNSIYNEKDLKYVTNPFKQDDGFPATAQDYNIIKPYVDQLLGEETKRPFNFHPQRTSDIAASELLEKAKQMLLEYIQATIASKLSPEQAARYEQALATGEVQTPEAIAKYLEKDYKDIAETEAYHALQFLKRKLNLTHEFYKGWKDALIGGEEIYYTGIINGEPYVERVNPMYFDYERSLDLEFIDEAGWCRRKMIMSATEIYDRFYDKMSERQLNELLELIDQRPGAGNNPEIRKTSFDYESIKMYRMNSFTDNPFDVDHITVYHCCWKSFKKIGFVTLLNAETGEVEEFQVDEDYKVTGTEQSVEWDWIIEVWEGYRIGDDMYIGIQPIEYQHVSADNPNSQKLPYTGVVYNNTNSQPRSLVSMMKPLLYMYIVVWYRLELALSRDKGKVILMDVTQIPKSMNIDVNKWMHYLSALGVALVNPYECFDPDTIVLMADGSRKAIKNIKVGEYVMGADGTHRKVLSTHNGFDHMYKLNVLTGGEDQIVNSKHKIYYKEKDYNKQIEYTKLANPVDLLKEDNAVHYKKNIRYLQRTSQVDSDWNAELLLDPYILGLWLGDGSTNKAEFTSEDMEVINAIANYAETNDMVAKIKTISDSNAVNISLVNKDNIVSNNTYVSKNKFKESLRHYNIINNKQIPTDYIYTTRENRLQLLAGLIDTDGYFSKRDQVYTFSQSESRKQIALDFAFIARSLGFKCTVRKYKTSTVKLIRNNKKSSICEDTWTVRILDGNLIIPTRIARKQGSVKKTKGNALQSNFKITYNGIGEYCGITVDNDNLFVLGDFTIVHNCDWDIPGREGGHAAAFNQFQSVDLTMSNVIAEYIQLMLKIEDMVAKLTGITPQRQGLIAASELVGNTNTAVTMSYHITEPWFWNHNQVKRRVLTMLLNTAKSAWKDNKQYLNYVLDDATRAFIQLSDNFFYEDMDIFVDDSTKNQQYMDQLKQLLQPAMQNGASLLDVAEIITLDNISMIKDRLAEIEQKRMEQIQQQQQAEQQAQQQIADQQNQIKEEELMIKEAEMDLKKYEIDQNNATKITVAELNAYRGSEDMDANGNNIPDVMEIANQALEERKASSEQAAKQLELNNKRREIEMKKDIEDKKIQLEKDRMKHETDLQKIQDKAAMEREKLKAKTAIRNKVAGEAKSKK